jgi:hypothetical protein
MMGGLGMSEDFNITGSIKVIEWLKAELLGAVAALYRVLLKGSRVSQEVISDSIAGIIILSYLLAKRLGIDFSSVDQKIQGKLKVGIIEEDEIEKAHGDLSMLLGYIKDRKQG